MWIHVGLFGYLVGLSVFDIRKKRLPVPWLIAGGVFAAAYMGACLYLQDGRELLSEWGIGVLPGVLMLLFALASDRAGTGDGCVLLMTGILEGARGMLIFGGSLMLAAGYSVFLLVVRRRGRGYRFPYVPFIAAAQGLGILLMLSGAW